MADYNDLSPGQLTSANQWWNGGLGDMNNNTTGLRPMYNGTISGGGMDADHNGLSLAGWTNGTGGYGSQQYDLSGKYTGNNNYNGGSNWQEMITPLAMMLGPLAAGAYMGAFSGLGGAGAGAAGAGAEAAGMGGAGGLSLSGGGYGLAAPATGYFSGTGAATAGGLGLNAGTAGAAIGGGLGSTLAGVDTGIGSSMGGAGVGGAGGGLGDTSGLVYSNPSLGTTPIDTTTANMNTGLSNSSLNGSGAIGDSGTGLSLSPNGSGLGLQPPTAGSSTVSGGFQVPGSVGTAPAPTQSGLGGLFNTVKGGYNSLFNTPIESLGGITGSQGMNGVRLASSLYDMFAKNKMAGAEQDRYNALNNQIMNSYAPGSPELKQLRDAMAAKDAAAGRNSQYGAREVNLAAQLNAQKIAQQAAINQQQNGLLNSTLANRYGGLNSLFGYMGLGSGKASVLGNGNGANPASIGGTIGDMGSLGNTNYSIY